MHALSSIQFRALSISEHESNTSYIQKIITTFVQDSTKLAVQSENVNITEKVSAKRNPALNVLSADLRLIIKGLK